MNTRMLETAGLGLLAFVLLVGVAGASGQSGINSGSCNLQTSNILISGTQGKFSDGLQFINVGNGPALRVWQTIKVSNTGSTPLTNAIMTVKFLNSGVTLLNSNGMFSDGVYYMHLGTIPAGGSVGHVLNVYDPSGSQFEMSVNVLTC